MERTEGPLANVDSMKRYLRRYGRLKMLQWKCVAEKMECRGKGEDYIVPDEQHNTLERVNPYPIHSQQYA